jgi:hypothetical protein
MGFLFAYRCTRGDERAEIEEIRQLAYDAQSGNFTVGLTVTGGTSGATGVIVNDADAGTTGALTLRDVSGDFQNNETITDSGSGSATVNGTDFCPQEQPSDGIIVQIDSEDMTKAEAVELLDHVKAEILSSDGWPKRA